MGNHSLSRWPWIPGQYKTDTDYSDDNLLSSHLPYPFRQQSQALLRREKKARFICLVMNWCMIVRFNPQARVHINVSSPR